MNRRRTGKRKAHFQRIIGITLILLALLIWNVPGEARAAGTATLADGETVNAILKKLVPGSGSSTYRTADTHITKIVWDEEGATVLGAANIAAPDSQYPIYVDYYDGVLSVYSVADGIALNPSARYLLYGFEALQDASGLLDHITDTSGTEHMGHMFYNCKSLEELDLGSFDTTACKFFTAMFDGCTALKKLDLSSFDMSNRNGDGSDIFGLHGLTSLEELVTPACNFPGEVIRLPGDFSVLNDDGSLGTHVFTYVPEGTELSSVTLRKRPVGPTQSPSPSPEPTVSPSPVPSGVPTESPYVSPSAVPTAVPTIRPTTAPTAVPTVTPTAVSTATPSAVPSTTPTRTPTASARTSASPTPPVVTPVRSGTPRPTATSTVSATPAPTSNPSSTATPNGGGSNNNGGSASDSGNYTYYNPYAVVNNGRKGNAYDMPRTGDGDSFRLIAVAALFVTGCIVLISSIPSRKRN